MDKHTAIRAHLEYASAGASQSPLALLVLPTRITASTLGSHEKHASLANDTANYPGIDFVYASHGNLIIAQARWDCPNGCRVTSIFAAHQAAAITCIKLVEHAFDHSADGSVRMLTAGSDGKWKLWDLHRTAETLFRFQQCSEQQLNGTVTAVSGINYAKDHNYIAAVDSTFHLMLYRNKTLNNISATEIAGSAFECVCDVEIHHQAVNDMQFSCISAGSADKCPSSVILACAVANSVVIYGVDDRSGANGSIALIKLCQLNGHEDWIQHLSFSPVLGSADNGIQYRLLSSASQDSTVRLWRIAVRPITFTNSDNDIFENLVEQTISNRFVVPTNEADVQNVCTATYEALLFGHDGWVYSAHWMWDSRKLQLVTASLDKTIIIWNETSTDIADPSASNVWSETCRMGIVGGNLPGFYGAVPFVTPGNEIKYVIAHSFTGSIHIWSNDTTDDTWRSRVSTGGHSQPVQSICWSSDEPEGNLYLLSSGFDQTTRLHGCWQTENSSFEWHELARPQIHGHDINAICNIGRFMFASGAEEKVIRLFQAPKNFRQNFSRLTGSRLHSEDAADLPDGANVPSLGLSNKPVYAVSKSRVVRNDAGDAVSHHVADDDDEVNHQSGTGRGAELYPEVYFKPLQLSKPPSEEDLLQHTLWAEMHKLYGHPNEIFALCSTTCGNVTLLASACKANKKDLASIFIWDLSETVSTPLTVQRVPPPIIDELEFHTATVTQMRFCPPTADERLLLLLSVSRDRTWALWSRAKFESDAKFRLAATSPAGVKGGGHSRIIWCCAWSPCGRFFVTGSRDKTLAVWLVRSDQPDAEHSISVELQAKLSFAEPVMAADICMLHAGNGNTAIFLIAIGLENGVICFRQANLSTTKSADNGQKSRVSCDAENSMPSDSPPSSNNLLRNGPVQQLGFAWRKKPFSSTCEKCSNKRNNFCLLCNDLLLASSGADHSVRIFSLDASDCR